VPELPEVETVRRGLAELLVNYRINEVQELHRRVRKSSSLAPISAIEGARITGVNRRGKYLWFELDRPQVLVAHLGMSGQFLFQQRDRPRAKHVRALFKISKGVRNKELVFNDQRTFGWLSVEELADGVPTSAVHVGLDPFDLGFDKRVTARNYVKRNLKIKTALLSQAIMSGVGNIYADEALWRAKVHPELLTSDMSMKRIELVIESAIGVMGEAILKGGTSFDELYINVNGESGFFEQSLAAYGQTDRPCPRCGTPIKRIIVGQRSSHFCPRCQRKRG
jgi:formamidopyrimidine-DNA glycosylase